MVCSPVERWETCVWWMAVKFLVSSPPPRRIIRFLSLCIREKRTIRQTIGLRVKRWPDIRNDIYVCVCVCRRGITRAAAAAQQTNYFRAPNPTPNYPLCVSLLLFVSLSPSLYIYASVCMCEPMAGYRREKLVSTICWFRRCIISLYLYLHFFFYSICRAAEWKFSRPLYIRRSNFER